MRRRGRQWGHGPGRVRGQPDAASRSAAVPAALPGRGGRSRLGPVVRAGGLGQDSLALTRRAVAAGASLVFAAGGDGTVRACAEALAGTGVPLAIVPLGTANLTARALGVPSQGGRAVEAGFGGRDHAIDLAIDAGGRRGRDMVRRHGGHRPGRRRGGRGGRAAQAAARLGRLRGGRGAAAGAAAARVHHRAGRRRTAAPAGAVRGGGQRRAAARRVHPAARGQARRRPARRRHPRRRRAAGTGSGWPDGCWPRAGARIGRWNACRRAASRSAPIPFCRGRSTARSSRPAGRLPSRCAREP